MSVLKDMIHDILNDREDEASGKLHTYLQDKMRSVAGFAAGEETIHEMARKEAPIYDEFSGDIEELLESKHAVKAWVADVGITGAADTLIGYWLYDGWEKQSTPIGKKVVATVVDSTGEHQNEGAMIYEGHKVTAKQAVRWYKEEMGLDDDDDYGGGYR